LGLSNSLMKLNTSPFFNYTFPNTGRLFFILKKDLLLGFMNSTLEFTFYLFMKSMSL